MTHEIDEHPARMNAVLRMTHYLRGGLEIEQLTGEDAELRRAVDYCVRGLLNVPVRVAGNGRHILLGDFPIDSDINLFQDELEGCGFEQILRVDIP